MYGNYAHVMIFSFIGAGIVLAPIILFALIRPFKPHAEKLTSYECGERVVGAPWVQFNIRYYIICLVFIIFEVEILLVFPWAVVYKAFIGGGESLAAIAPAGAHLDGATGAAAFGAMFIFMVILTVGLAYDWGKGFLEWQREMTPIPEETDEEAAADEKAA